jgi:transposase
MAGESRRKVAADMNVSDGTVRRWLERAERRESAQDEKMADDAASLAERIAAKQEQVREQLLRRIAELAPTTDDLRAVATAYGIVTDKSLLTAGKPTGIHEHRASDPLDAEIEQLLSEEAAKRHGDAAEADAG